MRPVAWIAVISIASLTAGCAHVGASPPQTQMVEVTDGSIVPGPSQRPDPPATPAQRRRHGLLVAGGVLTVTGAVIAAIGIGFFVAGIQEQNRCAHDSPSSPCGLGGGFEQAIGGVVLGVGVPPLAAGLGLIGAGAGIHP